MNKTIETSELQQLQRDKAGFALINVLSESEFQKGSISGSTNAPIDDSDFLKHVAAQTRGDKQMRVILYCAGPRCDASTRAANELVNAGYTNVEEYRGGMEVWHTSPPDGRVHRGNGIASGEHREADLHEGVAKQ